MAKPPLKDAKRFDYRVGSGNYVIGGMVQDLDPGAVPKERPRLIVNGRFQGGGIVSRPPFRQFEILPPISWLDPDDLTADLEYYDATVRFLAEHSPTRQATQLWIGAYDTTSNIVGLIETPLQSGETLATYPSIAQAAPVVERYSGEVYVGDYGSLRRIYRVKGPRGESGVSIASLPTDDILYTFPGYQVGAMSEYNGRLFIYLYDPTFVAVSYVVSYDGNEIYPEITLSIPTDGAAAFHEFKGNLLLLYKLPSGFTGTATLHKRDKAGAWTTVTPVGEVYYGAFSGAICSQGDYVYWAGGTVGLAKYYEPSGTATIDSYITPTEPNSTAWNEVQSCCATANSVFCGGQFTYQTFDYATVYDVTSGYGEYWQNLGFQTGHRTVSMAVHGNRIAYAIQASREAEVHYFDSPRMLANDGKTLRDAYAVTETIYVADYIGYMKGDR